MYGTYICMVSKNMSCFSEQNWRVIKFRLFIIRFQCKRLENSFHLILFPPRLKCDWKSLWKTMQGNVSLPKEQRRYPLSSLTNTESLARGARQSLRGPHVLPACSGSEGLRGAAVGDVEEFAAEGFAVEFVVALSGKSLAHWQCLNSRSWGRGDPRRSSLTPPSHHCSCLHTKVWKLIRLC